MKGRKSTVIRIVILFIGLFVGALYIGPLIKSNTFNLGNFSGLTASLIIIFYSALFKKVNFFISNFWQKTSGKIVLSTIFALIAVLVVYISFLSVNIAIHGKDNNKPNTNIMIVLGCQVRGYEPGPYQMARINKAYEYLKNNPNSIAVLSGGQGKGENISEAQCMFNELTAKGIDKSRLLMEDKSTSTGENFLFSKKLLEENGYTPKELIVVTNDFHQYRASLIAKNNGIKTYSQSAKTTISGGIPTFFTRELFAVTVQYVKTAIS